ncbi:MAG: 50S ribosomal protein L9 [SAR202 cluster bacterium]|nr:50S ribosomal protein L9 [SAR202 cluster bacterium]
MQVLFLEDVTNVANAGEVKEVARGYARNYLFPKKLATAATPETLKRVNKIEKVAEVRRNQEMEAAKSVAGKMGEVTLKLRGRVGPTGQYYGAISVTRIIEELEAATGQKVERRVVELSQPIREPGTYKVSLRLHQEVAPEITVVAEAEGETLVLEEPEEPEEKGEEREEAETEEEKEK